MPQSLPTVFVSSTSSDLGSFREAAAKALRKIGCHPLVQDDFSTDYRAVEAMLRDKIDRCDAVICLTGFTFGAHPAERPERSYTQIEYDIARSLGLPIIRFLATEDCKFDKIAVQTDRERDLQREFRRQLEAANELHYPFSDHHGLRELVLLLRDSVQRAASETPSRLRKQYDQIQQARFDPLLIDFLKSYYPYPLLERGGLTYPVFCLPTSDEQSTQLESILGPKALIDQDRASYPAPNEQYRELLARLGKQLYNGRLYVMERACLDGPLRLECSMGWYYDALETCDALEWELLAGLTSIERGDGVLDRLRKALPLRNGLRAINPCLDGTGRCAALSIATLIVCKDGATDRALIRVRSGLTAAHSDLYHVFPSFMMENSWAEEPHDEYSVLHQVLREYLEEVFDEREVQKSAGQLSHQWFYQHPQAVRLREMLATGRAQLFLTGYAVNLLNLRPEICTLLLIHDPEWFVGDIRSNWEFLSPSEANDRRGRSILKVGIRRDDDAIAADLRRLPGTFVPPGAAAFWLGIDRARQVVGSD